MLALQKVKRKDANAKNKQPSFIVNLKLRDEIKEFQAIEGRLSFSRIKNTQASITKMYVPEPTDNT